MEKILRTIEKLIPKRVYHLLQPYYHKILVLIGAIIYGFPARKLYIIGVTGTKGKSSTTELINSILEASNKKTAVANTIRFKIDKDSRPNKFKMSMPGRFFMQKFLHDAVKAGCTHAVVEITSEGARFFRHKFIYLDAFVFTNLAREHIESHGSYENYRQAKVSITKLLDCHKKNTIMVVNGDDPESVHFLKEKADKKLSYKLDQVRPYDLTSGIKMRFNTVTIYSKLEGKFNVCNILSACTVTSAMGIGDEIIKKGIEGLSEILGRAQKISVGQNFEVVVDYAHTKESLEALYKTYPDKRKICVLGNTGGGRDQWKRPAMAKVAEQYCDEIILTNEDPYDEDPLKIIEDMEKGLVTKKAQVILNRREAINSALRKANSNSIVLITGKGTDPYIMEADGKKTPWSDAVVVREELKKILKRS